MAEFAANIAVILGALGIPLVLYLVGKFAEKKRATLETIKTLSTAPEIVDRLNRLYQSRLYEDAVEAGVPEADRPTNPYREENGNKLIFDIVLVLNYFDAACVEILNKAVIEKRLYAASKDHIIGVRKVILSRLERLTGQDQSQAYSHLIEISNRWENRAIRKQHSLVGKIPKIKAR